MSLKDFTRTARDYWGRGLDAPKEKTVIGLEAENEFKTAVEFPKIKGWKFHTENSLRHSGYEYVLDPPKEKEIALERTETLLAKLNSISEEQNAPITSSIRTSWHVHFNAGHYTFLDVLNFACLYWMLEPLLSPFAGEHRQGNLFCLRLKDASWLRYMLVQSIEERTAWQCNVFNEQYRYASLNFNSLSKFGTLESRLMRGTTDFKEVETWVETLDAIRKFALRYENPIQLKTDFLDKYHASEFPYEVLGDQYKRIAKYFPNGFSVEKEVRAGFMEVLPIMSAHDTFDFREEIKKWEEEELIREAKRKADREVVINQLNAAAQATNMQPQVQAPILGWNPPIGGWVVDSVLPVALPEPVEAGEFTSVFLYPPSDPDNGSDQHDPWEYEAYIPDADDI